MKKRIVEACGVCGEQEVYAKAALLGDEFGHLGNWKIRCTKCGWDCWREEVEFFDGEDMKGLYEWHRKHGYASLVAKDIVSVQPMGGEVWEAIKELMRPRFARFDYVLVPGARPANECALGKTLREADIKHWICTVCDGRYDTYMEARDCCEEEKDRRDEEVENG